MAQDNNIKTFLALLRAGLWGKADDNVNLNDNHYEGLDWGEVQKLAEEQAVVGLVTAGVEKLPACTFFTESNSNQRCSVPFQGIPLTEKLTLLGKCQLIEQHNIAQNHFIGALIQKLNAAGIKAVLVKGQGIAQCYTKPLWRSSGDVDLFFDAENYRKAVALLKPLASDSKHEGRYSKHLGLTIDSWYIELQGTQRVGLSSRLERVIDAVQRDTFENNRARLWHNGDVDVLLPVPDNDVFFVFTHFLKHFFKEYGFCLRQLCDWCRLLWTYREVIDAALLEQRLRKAGLMSEWKAFAALAVEHLGMPIEAMPLYDSGKKWSKKAEKILAFAFDNSKHGKLRNTLSVAKTFPCDTLRFLPGIIWEVNGMKVWQRLFNN